MGRDQHQVLSKQWKVSCGAENIFRIAGFLIMTTKHTFPREQQL